jgi:hypothetical protein
VFYFLCVLTMSWKKWQALSTSQLF